MYTLPSTLNGSTAAVPEVPADLDEAGPLPWIHLKYLAAYTCMLMFARCPVGSSACTEGDLAQLEVPLEVAPLLLGGFAVFLGWAVR
jgi:hypothetical protein